MVVGDFAAVRYAVYIWLANAVLSKGHIVPHPENQGGSGSLHILGQILAVRPGISRQLFLIEGLHIVKGLLCRIAIDTVTFPLQSCQVIQAGRLYGLDLFLHRPHRSGLPVTVPADFFSFIFPGQLFPRGSKAAAGDLRHIKRLARKCLNICLPLYQKGQRGRHDTPHIKRDAIQDREKPGGVNADQPVSPSPADRRVIELIVIAARTQVFKPVTDCRILHTGNPEAFHRFLTSGVLIDQTEDQFALPSSVGSAYHRFHPFVLHQPAKKVKLLFLILRHLIFPCFRQDRQITITPSGILFPISLRLCQFQKVPHAPAHQVAASLQVAVFFLIRTQNRRQRHGDGGLFRNY